MEDEERNLVGMAQGLYVLIEEEEVFCSGSANTVSSLFNVSYIFYF